MPEPVSIRLMKIPKKSELAFPPPPFHLPRFAALEKEGQDSNEDKTWNFLEYPLLSLAKFGKQMAVEPRLWCEAIKGLLPGQREGALL